MSAKIAMINIDDKVGIFASAIKRKSSYIISAGDYSIQMNK